MQDNNSFHQESVNEEKTRPSVEEVVNETVPEAEEAPRKPKKSWKKELREWIVSLAAALMVVFFIRNFMFQIIRVDGKSMYDTLDDNERLFVTVYDVRFSTVDRGDIVICHYPNRGNTNFVKRVVAVPGDTLYCKDGVTHVVYETTDESGATVTVDEMLDENNKYNYFLGNGGDYSDFTLGENQYFVVGDNRYNSHDSRAGDVGPITGDMIVGHVRSVIWPLSSIRTVE